jgi:flagellar hook-associated protein 3 FlgL
MAISPINISRVSHNLRTDFMVDSMRRTQRDLFLSQAQIASGRSFITASEDPIAAARALDLGEALTRQNQFTANLQHGDNFLAAADSAITEISGLINDASVIASQTVSNLTTAAERQSEAEVVAAICQQLQAVGNRQFMGRYIFGGRNTTDRPFVDALGAVGYVGDTGDLLARIGNGLWAPINIPGDQLFGALSSPINTDVDLTPLLTASTRLDDITGAGDQAIRQGVLVFNEVGGAGAFSVDLREADTIGDVVDRINAAAAQAGARLTASLDDTALVITPAGSAVTITDTGTGAIAADLGLYTSEPTTDTITGEPLLPRLTRITPVETLAQGAGVDLEHGLIITNDERTVTVDLSTAETVQDVINTINNAGVFVLARINEAGTGIDIFNQVSGTSLSIGENGGTTAADLGIRTFDSATPLTRLNFGRGVNTIDEQDDLRITARDGSTVDVNLDGAVTVGDVIELINEAATDAGVDVTASFAETGNGIRLTDETGGSGRMSVHGLNLSTAAMDLGLTEPLEPEDTELVGDDVNPTRTEGIIGALVDLDRALRTDDTQAISAAGARLDELGGELTRMHGVVGARSQAMTSRLLQMEEAATSTQVFLSQVRDLDYAEAVTQLQAAVTQFQGSLQASSALLNLSLLDFLS